MISETSFFESSPLFANCFSRFESISDSRSLTKSATLCSISTSLSSASSCLLRASAASMLFLSALNLRSRSEREALSASSLSDLVLTSMSDFISFSRDSRSFSSCFSNFDSCLRLFLAMLSLILISCSRRNVSAFLWTSDSIASLRSISTLLSILSIPWLASSSSLSPRKAFLRENSTSISSLRRTLNLDV